MALTTFYKRPSSEYNSTTYGTSIFSCSDTGEAYLFGSKIKIKWEDVINPPTIGSAVAWDDITGKPSWIDSDTKPSYNWSEIGGKPSTFTPSAHTHSISDVTDLQVALNDKVSLSSDSFKPNNMCWGGTRTDGTTTCLAFINSENIALFGHTSLPLRLRSSSNPTVLVGTSTYTLLHTGNIGSITFTGAATGTFTGLNDLTINIPQGGGEADSVAWENVTRKPSEFNPTLNDNVNLDTIFDTDGDGKRGFYYGTSDSLEQKSMVYLEVGRKFTILVINQLGAIFKVNLVHLLLVLILIQLLK